jgi:anaerobic selenocysteine-containing dehydrogenase
MMHTVIANAVAGDPYRIDTLFMYMANMAWNSAMNTSETLEMLTRKDPETGEYCIPHIIYSDAYSSETINYADLILPDTTYLERWDCISIMDRPISSAEGPADSIRQPVVQPDRDVRPFQDVLIELGARIGLPGLLNEAGHPKYPGGYPDFIANHEYRPGIGSLAGWRGEGGDQAGTGEPNPNQLQRYIDNGCYWHERMPDGHQYMKHFNQGYLDYAVSRGFIGKSEPVVIQLYSEQLQRFRLAAEGFGAVQPPDSHRGRIGRFFDPLPIWYEPFGHQLDGGAGPRGEEAESATELEKYPIHALTQRPMAMYHSWGSQNAWLRQLHTYNRLYVSEAIAREHAIADDDWVWLSSPQGQVRCQAKVMQGVNTHTVWTWNAIGKRKGAWNLAEDAPESQRGFLLNHLIADLLPERAGYRFANADPVTGQAAWYDLRVQIRKAEEDEPHESYPQFTAARSIPGSLRRTSVLQYGAQFSAAPAPQLADEEV